MRERIVTVDELADAIVHRYDGRRLLVALAGAPGSGKSTLAKALSAAIDARAPDLAANLPMDGFHYDDAVLGQLGRLAQKGAPDTFDVAGLMHMLRRLAANDEEAVALPVFDRALEASRAAARLIPRGRGVVIAEGNYLLLKRSPWNQLYEQFNVTVMVRASQELLRLRLEARWRFFKLPEAEVRRKVDTNDLPNGVIVVEESRPADFVIDQSGF